MGTKNTVQKNKRLKNGDNAEKNYIFAENLNKAMKLNNIKTQKDLASLLVVAEPTITAWVKQKKSISKTNLKILADALNVNEAYLLGKTDIPDKDASTFLVKRTMQAGREKVEPIALLLESIGINIEVKEENDGESYLYFRYGDYEPMYIDNEVFSFFVNEIRNHAKLLFTDFYNSPMAFNMSYNHLLEQKKDSVQTEITPQGTRQFKYKTVKEYID